uniref:SDE2-like C-terminal domain-containing protein n=1 Tax=Panagrolaimus sp. ES5 TaxID=591445 RepID=A0AC34FXP9_9BILA
MIDIPVIEEKKVRTEEFIVKKDKKSATVKQQNKDNSSGEKAPANFDPIDVESVSDAKELEAYGLEHLKHELECRGLKCGGSLSERATRLFSIKGLTPDHYPKKILAAAAKK